MRWLFPLILCCAWAAELSADQRPNFLVLISDDQRPDTIGALGNPHIKTPHLDALVKRGTTFTRATCANPICTPSRAEIITGCGGFKNGTLDFGGKIDPSLPTWAGTLKTAGYRTGYVGKWHNNGRPELHGYDETPGLYSGGGAEWYRDQVDWNGRPVTGYRGWIFQSGDGKELYPEQGVGLTPAISTKFADAAIGFLQEKSTQPFFLQVNFTAPHDPLLLPPGLEKLYSADQIPLPQNFLERHPFEHGNFEGRDELLFAWPRTSQEVREELVAYYAVITHLDQQVGRILDALQKTGQLERTLVLFTSDHGLGLGSHGLRGKQNMYDHTIGVPLIIAGPGLPADRRVNGQCYLRDLFPTTCELAGVSIPAAVEGKSLVPLIQGHQQEIYPAIFGYYRQHQRMIRTDRWKLIHYPQVQITQLFDLQHDPQELRNLADDPRHQATRRQLEQQLAAWQQQQQDPVLKD